MTQRRVSGKDGPKSVARPSPCTDRDSQPPPEDQLGGGDICSLEEEPSTEDDKPLD